MTDRKHNRRPSLSTILAGAALFAALGGSAYAAKEAIDGGDIAKGTVASKQIKNETVKVKDLNAKTIAALAGQDGKDGKDGANGTNGTDGTDGKDGIVAPLVATKESGTNLNQNNDATVHTLNTPPAGKYMVTAKTTLVGTLAGEIMECSIVTGGDFGDHVAWTVPANTTRAPVHLQEVVTVDAGESIAVSCYADNQVGTTAVDTSIIATPVQG